MNNNDVGSIEYTARIDTKQLKSDAKRADSIVQDAGDSMERTGDKSSRSFVKLGATIGAVSGVVTSVLDRAITSVTDSIGSAINRVDTLNNASRTFANMGFEVADVTKAMADLDASIKGLPTPIDAAVKGVQMLSGATGDVGRSQQIFSSLNNAILGFGGTAADVSGAILQISQAFAGGIVDAATWNSMLERNLGPALNAIAKDMGLTTKALKEGLSEGTISVEKFQDALIKMNKEGGGGLASFEKIAKDSTSGIATGFANAQTAIVRGVAKIIEAIGSARIGATVSTIGVAFETVLKSISEGVTIARYAIETFLSALKPVFDFIGGNQKVFEVLKLSLIAIASIVGAIILALGVGLVAAFTIVVGAIQVAIFVFERIIEAVMAFSNGIANSVNSMIDLWNTAGRVVNGIKVAFQGLPSFFSSLWGSIVKLFGDVGVTIGNAIGNTFNSVINGVLNTAVGIINGFIDAINKAVDVINEVPGVNVGRISRLEVPHLAEGGIVSSPTLSMIGEGKEAEAVIPLSKLDKMLSNGGQERSGGKVEMTINMSGIMASSPSDERAIAKRLIERFNEEMRSKGKPELGVA